MAERVIVVGGGIAGLTAALTLAPTHSVTVLEARHRLGGRVHTLHGPDDFPYELGAEFIHGRSPETWRFIREADLPTHEVPDRHWKHQDQTITELPDFWDQLASITDEISPDKLDMSFARFIARQRSQPRESIELAKGFIEGFHAAPLEKASLQATRLTDESSEQIEGNRQLRITTGYDAMVHHVEKRCRQSGVHFRLGTPVASINRADRQVTLRTAAEEIHADRVLVTLPIGVLKTGPLRIDPRPDTKFEAINALDMGIVTKVVLHFRKRFWPEPDFGFIHSDNEWLPTWWSDQRGHILTGWGGGPKGERLARFDQNFIIQRALECASSLFGETLPRTRELLIAAHTHNWLDDPFSRGAYSYIPVNGTDACQELARPEAGRLFFAGEATDLNYQFGTVHGAIASGFRAARQVKEEG